MTMREQPGVPLSFRTRRTPATFTQGASRYRTETSSGFHPEDRPSQTDERHRQGLLGRHPIVADLLDDDDDDALYSTRVPSSARRYMPTTTPPRTVMRATRHQGPPPIQRASRRQAETDEQRAHAPVQRHTWSWHPLLSIGIALLVMLVVWIALSRFSHWWQNEQDTLHYGYPRTFQIDATVGHGGISHFTVENLDGQILISEVQLSNLAHAHVYVGPVFSGSGADQQPATISFADVNGDGFPDLILAVGVGRYIFINTRTGFRPATPTDTVKGV